MRQLCIRRQATAQKHSNLSIRLPWHNLRCHLRSFIFIFYGVKYAAPACLLDHLLSCRFQSAPFLVVNFELPIVGYDQHIYEIITTI